MRATGLHRNYENPVPEEAERGRKHPFELPLEMPAEHVERSGSQHTSELEFWKEVQGRNINVGVTQNCSADADREVAEGMV